MLTSSYTRNSEWKLKWIRVYIPSKSINNTHSEVKIQILAQRRPFFIFLNVILPAIFLSFLNIMVFVIPADSGEKISYGITVLLALSVFLGTVGGMLPKSSNVPMVTVYLFILLILSMLTVINSIIIVFLHHKEEKEEKHWQVKTYFSRTLNKITNFRHAVSPVAGAADNQVNQRADLGPEIGSKTKKPESPGVNRYKVIGKYIHLVSFVVFLVTWSAVTISVMKKILKVKKLLSVQVY
ncbi:5-hydroxytryptamine receptor 3A [Bulinus truncatus]|nr:5-hydroxytryptamine receptor 3A [Bulinus truncatus]